jgi:hypothetical protein
MKVGNACEQQAETHSRPSIMDNKRPSDNESDPKRMKLENNNKVDMEGKKMLYQFMILECKRMRDIAFLSALVAKKIC